MSHLHLYIQFALAGMAGALVRSLMDNKGSILLVKRWEKDGKSGLDLGIVGSLCIGAAVGVVVDQHWLAAFFGALSGTLILDEVIKKQKTPPSPPGEPDDVR